ncbi:MAG: NUDIX hydrolase [Minisyncoccia bacterium]
MIHLQKPEKFNSKFEVVSCFFEQDGKILLLHRQDHKPQGNTWGVPAGKVEDGENPLQAIVRELEEETGYGADEDQFKLLGTVFVQYPDYDFIYYTFYFPLTGNYEVKIESKAHKAFEWMTPEDALNKDLIPDLDNCIKLYYNLS